MELNKPDNPHYTKILLGISILSILSIIFIALPIDKTYSDHLTNSFYAYLFCVLALNGIILQMLPYYVFGKLADPIGKLADPIGKLAGPVEKLQSNMTIFKQYMFVLLLTIIQIILGVVLLVIVEYAKKTTHRVREITAIFVGIIIGTLFVLAFGTNNVLIYKLCKGKYGVLICMMTTIIWYSISLVSYYSNYHIITIGGIIGFCIGSISYFNIFISQVYHRYMYKRELEYININNFFITQ